MHHILKDTYISQKSSKPHQRSVLAQLNLEPKKIITSDDDKNMNDIRNSNNNSPI